MIVRNMSRLVVQQNPDVPWVLERITRVTIGLLKTANDEYEREFPWSLKRATAAGKIKALKEIYHQLQITEADMRSLSEHHAQQDLISL